MTKARYENANTANIIHKLVTVFARASFPLPNSFTCSPNPDDSSEHKQVFCTVTHDRLLPRLYRERSVLELSSELAAKTRAVLRSIRLWWHNLHSQFAVIASFRLSNVYELYCRAVSTHFSRH
jgi:hypothetical protein